MKGYHSIYTTELISVLLELLSLINNYLSINLVSTRHMRPWYAKHKMSVDNSSQKIRRNMYTQDTDMHQFSIGKCIEKCKNVTKITPLQNDHTFLTWLLNLSK